MNNYTNPVTVTGNPASFEASGNGKLLSLSVPFSPIQDLHGYSFPWPAGGGVNLLPPQEITGGMSDVQVSSNGDKVTINGTASAYGQAVSANTFTLDAGTYFLKVFVVSGSVTGGYVQYQLRSVDGLTTYAGTAAGIEFTLQERTELKPRVTYFSGSVISNYIIQAMVVSGSTAPTAFAPYSNICPITGRTGVNVYVSPTQDVADATTYSVDWTDEAGTVYGGTDEVVGGVLTDEWAEIPSYNGETITEPWLSSMDEYAPGATPTTGAQVVYKLATPITYQLTPTQIALIIGQNNVWSDSNEAVTLTYVIKLFTRYTFIVNGNDYTGLVERDSYRTAVTPVYGETIQTLDGVGHTALLRLRGSITVGLNPQTKANTAAICADLLQSPVEVQYHCLQRNANVTALMVADTISAQFLSRCLANGDDWNKIEEITLTEL